MHSFVLCKWMCMIFFWSAGSCGRIRLPYKCKPTARIATRQTYYHIKCLCRNVKTHRRRGTIDWLTSFVDGLCNGVSQHTTGSWEATKLKYHRFAESSRKLLNLYYFKLSAGKTNDKNDSVKTDITRCSPFVYTLFTVNVNHRNIM